MENRLPLPTDNIYKFYALFGLLLFIFSVGSSIYTTDSSNKVVFDIAVEYQTLKEDPARTSKQESRYQLLNKQLEIIKSNRCFFKWGLGIVAALGTFMAFYGFQKWHKEIQPLQDELIKLNIEKLKKELGK